jgi:hypothetical protein
MTSEFSVAQAARLSPTLMRAIAPASSFDSRIAAADPHERRAGVGVIRFSSQRRLAQSSRRAACSTWDDQASLKLGPCCCRSADNLLPDAKAAEDTVEQVFGVDRAHDRPEFFECQPQLAGDQFFGHSPLGFQLGLS